MGSYFVRRLLGGMITWLLASFLFYSLLIWPTVPFRPTYRDAPLPTRIAKDGLTPYESIYALDKPWPLNYLVWLFDPNGTSGKMFTFPGGEVRGVHMSLETMGYVHSGILVGDLGYSLAVEPGTPVLYMLGLDGPGLPLLLGIPFSTLLFFMLVVVLQRRGRPPVYGSGTGDNPARRVWRRAEVWPIG